MDETNIFEEVKDFLDPGFNGLDYCKHITEEVSSTTGINFTLNELKSKENKVKEKIDIVLRENETLIKHQALEIIQIYPKVSNIQTHLAKNSKLIHRANEEILILDKQLRAQLNRADNVLRLRRSLENASLVHATYQKIIFLLDIHPDEQWKKDFVTNMSSTKLLSLCKVMDKPFRLSIESKNVQFKKELQFIRSAILSVKDLAFSTIKRCFVVFSEIDLTESLQLLENVNLFSEKSVDQFFTSLFHEDYSVVIHNFQQDMKAVDWKVGLEKLFQTVDQKFTKVLKLNKLLLKFRKFNSLNVKSKAWTAFSEELGKGIIAIAFFKSRENIKIYLEFRSTMFSFLNKQHIQDEELQTVFLKSFLHFTKFYLNKYYSNIQESLKLSLSNLEVTQETFEKGFGIDKTKQFDKYLLNAKQELIRKAVTKFLPELKASSLNDTRKTVVATYIAESFNKFLV
eukprot:maker-scaffold_2-snap-gene-16.34-mRNA-1 protein AED:0.00 eAED:0.00 QI:23/1/1/1/1/1/2/68/455